MERPLRLINHLRKEAGFKTECTSVLQDFHRFRTHENLLQDQNKHF